MKLALEEYQKSVKEINTNSKRLAIANKELERKLKAEKAERMSMSNGNSFISQGMGGGRFGGGGSKATNILSQSIMENSMAGGANTSIMDLMTGHSAPSMKEMANRSMSISQPKEHSFVSSQKSFFSKKPKGLMASKQDTVPAKDDKKDDNQYLITDGEFSSSEGGDIKKVCDFSDDNSEGSESSDCVVESSAKVKSTGFFHKLRLRDIMKQKGQGKENDIFREGESDEYNSEVDGEPSLDGEPEINYDLLDITGQDHPLHNDLLNLVKNHEELPDDWED